MRTAARHMVRNLTAGMAMITCRDQVCFLKSSYKSNDTMTIILYYIFF